MEKEKLIELLDKYQKGQLTQEEKQAFASWFGSLGTTLDDPLPTPLAEQEWTDENWPRLLAHLAQEDTVTTKVPVIRMARKYTTWWAAASVVFLLGLCMGAYFWIYKLDHAILSDTGAVTLVEKANTTQKALSVALPDGSSVLLQPASKVKYAAAFGATKREVILEGEAFFQVVKNPKKPFLVYTGDVTTQVLGTSFTVKAFRAQNIQVSVKTGKVSVFTANPKNKEKKIQSTDTLVVLTPNQRVIYSLEGKQFMKTLVENPQVIDQKTANLKLVFRNQPLNQVFDRLEEVYGVDIVYDAQALALCTLTADLSESPSLNENLTIICKSMAGSYHVTDSRVVITSPGCN